MRKKETVKILAIAPYPGLVRLFQDVATQRENIELLAYEADTIDAVSLVRTLPLNDYDVIISRGYTCRMIQDISGRHVLDVGISVYDVLRSIRIAQSYQGKFAIVGFYNIVHYAEILRDLLQYDLDIFTIQSIEEIDAQLKELKSAGYSMIIGDVITTTKAQKNDLQTILILTSKDSVDRVFDLALSLYKEQRKFASERTFLHTLISADADGLLVYNTSGELIFSNPVSKFPDIKQLEGIMQKYVPVTLENRSFRLVKPVGNIYLHIAGKVVTVDEADIIIFRIKGLNHNVKDTGFIRYYSRVDLEPVHQEMLHTLNPELKSSLESADNFRLYARPVMVIGEAGSGKDTFVRHLYSSHPECQEPIVIIDCALATQKSWEKLLQEDSSPLFDQKCVLYFKGIHNLSEGQRLELFQFIRGTALEKRCQLIFTSTYDLPLLPAQDPLIHEIVNVLQAQVIRIPSMNERREDIPNLVMLYLSELNRETMSTVVTFGAEALEVLQNYDWVDNFYQLRRVVKEIHLRAKSAVVGKEETIWALKQVESQRKNPPTEVDCFHGTLDEITRRAVHDALIKEKMNQTKAAKRLGISRSTLRRYMT